MQQTQVVTVTPALTAICFFLNGKNAMERNNVNSTAVQYILCKYTFPSQALPCSGSTGIISASFLRGSTPGNAKRIVLTGTWLSGYACRCKIKAEFLNSCNFLFFATFTNV